MTECFTFAKYTSHLRENVSKAQMLQSMINVIAFIIYLNSIRIIITLISSLR